MEPCALEGAESLEQLRALWYGVRIHLSVIDQPPGHGIDTPDDVMRVEKLLAAMSASQ
jgi:3-deoxy-manno-octulosonate cytidylyltransferase (CMP-KDO synthetase)